ncbi:MAG: efflux RND transporter permease subunit [Proteobacteria bacterium]|nr:efflux RND transporter permease subunit [Pseudomonadota bacterium]
MFSKFFIEKPLLSTVIAIVITLAGVIALKELAVQEYPALTPLQIIIRTVYPGADADTVSRTVAIPLEDSLNGVGDMIYISSTASSDGSLTMSVYFNVGTDPAMARVDVNNRVQIALSTLPEEVQKQGVIVRERSPDMLAVLCWISENQKRDIVSLSNYVAINVADDLKRVPGVGDVFLYGEKKYSMRVWLKPDKLAVFGLTPTEISDVIKAQNKQFTAGGIGDEPSSTEQIYTYSVRAESRLKTIGEFENIIIRSNRDGSSLKLKDVARVDLAAENYGMKGSFKREPAVAMGVFLNPGANAVAVGDAVKKKLAEMSKGFPPDVKYYLVDDITRFVRESIKEVIIALVISIILVIMVIYVFLGNLRATLIPVMAIPVSIIGTFAGIYSAGFSINLLTLFGLILAIGLVVDDAIVVIENVERILREEKLSVKEATVKAMQEITSPVIAIVLVLSAVFIPASFIGGFSGKMYQQFAITIAISVFISGIVALTLTPALCVIFLKETQPPPILPIRLFLKLFDTITNSFTKVVKLVIKTAIINIILFGTMIFLIFHLVDKLPSSLVPMEDKGLVLALNYMMPGTSLSRTLQSELEIERISQSYSEVAQGGGIIGLDFGSGATKTDSSATWVNLKDWPERKRPEQSARALAEDMNKKFYQLKNSLIFAVTPPPISGLSNTGGFEMYIQNRTGESIDKLNGYIQEIVKRANQNPTLMAVRTTLNTNVPHYSVVVNREKAKSLGVEIDKLYKTLQMTFGKSYVNDVNLYGKTYHVNMQSEGKFRESLNDYNKVFVRSQYGELVPVSSLITLKRIIDTSVVERFNMFPAAKIIGEPRHGFSSGAALKAIEDTALEVLPTGYTIAWAGTSYQEKSLAQTGYVATVYAVVFVFLILIALYESWLAPVAIILSIPFAIFGAILGVLLRGLESDIYFQVGIITLVGLAAKNAILIVEFAEERYKKHGMPLFEATVEAARIRFRPIVMTSFAFIAGTLPLALGTGAGAGSRNIIGTTVVAGMFLATTIGVFAIPLFYYLIMRAKQIFEEKVKR